jgi:hypothetical protein
MSFTSDEVRALIHEETSRDYALEEICIEGRMLSLLRDRQYYVYVRSAPARRAQENEALASKRRAARVERARSRPPCPPCGQVVTRGEVVDRGRKLPKYCTRKCMRAAVWARYANKRRGQP